MTQSTTQALCGMHGQPLTGDPDGRILCPVEGPDCTTWSDLQPEVGDVVRLEDGDVVILSEDGWYAGERFDIERTGGNCTALVHEAVEGVHIVLTNGDALHDTRGRVLAALYRDGGWHDGSEAVWTAEGDDADDLARQALAHV